MIIGNIDIHVGERDELILRKTKWVKYSSLIFALLLPLLVVIAMWIIFGNETVKIPKDVTVILLIILFGLALIAVLFFDTMRTIKNSKNYFLKVANGNVYINEKKFSSYKQLSIVFIQPVSGWKGLGTSYTVGILARGKKKCLSFNNNKADAFAIAKEISLYLKKEFVLNGSKAFTLFKGY